MVILHFIISIAEIIRKAKGYMTADDAYKITQRAKEQHAAKVLEELKPVFAVIKAAAEDLKDEVTLPHFNDLTDAQKIQLRSMGYTVNHSRGVYIVSWRQIDSQY